MNYSIVRSRRKTIAIHVLASGNVEVRAPLRCAVSDIQAFVYRQTEWIKTKQAQVASRSPALAFNSGDVIHFLGNEIELTLYSHSKRLCMQRDDQLFLYLKQGDAVQQRAELVRRWLTTQAEKILTERVYHMVNQCDFVDDVKKPKFRWMKRRWGSCSSKGDITLNIDLVRYPVELVDYVIAHELCHLVHFNHSADFYHLLGQLFPDWRVKKRELQSWHHRYGHQLTP